MGFPNPFDKAKEVLETGKDALGEVLETGKDAGGKVLETGKEALGEALETGKDALGALGEGAAKGYECLASNFRAPEATLLAVVDGALIACDQAKILGKLSVPSSSVPEIAGRSAATVEDHVVGSNLLPFPGNCRATGRPCDPSPIPDWVPAAKGLQSRLPLLPSNALLRCEHGGILSIKDPGQADIYVQSEGIPLSPPGVDIELNILIAGLMKQRPLQERLIWFYYQVRTGGPWDYKKGKHIEYEDFGNYNYGATGRALGIPEPILRRMAGLVQENPEPDWGSFIDLCGDSSFSDDPRDQEMIDAGIHHD